MDKDTKHTLIVIALAVVIIAGAFIGVSKASGVSPPQTVVESESMQRGVGSQIGIIDTGDVVLLKDKSKVSIQSYVDGYKSGYRMFGNYGDVIIYDRGPNENPVIHRAILYLEYNEREDGSWYWSAPSLVGYPSDLWNCTNNDPGNMFGTLILYGMGYAGDKDPVLDLNSLASRYPHSGYITMGDNNSLFDQPNLVGITGLVTYESIKSVAWIEIPWMGVIKMAMNGKMERVNSEAPNSVPCLVASVLLIIFLIVGLSFLFDYRYYGNHRKEIYDEMNAPAPPFPVEDEDD